MSGYFKSKKYVLLLSRITGTAITRQVPWKTIAAVAGALLYV